MNFEKNKIHFLNEMKISLSFIDTLHMATLYSKCPKISYTKVTDKMAYAKIADPDPTAPIPLSILRNDCFKSKI